MASKQKTLEQRSLKILREEGATVDVCQRWIPLDNKWEKKKRRDLFYIFDIVAVRPDFKGVLGLQVTSQENIYHRLKKIRESKEALMWLGADNQIEVWGWTKPQRLWVLKRKEVHINELRSDPF